MAAVQEAPEASGKIAGCRTRKEDVDSAIIAAFPGSEEWLQNLEREYALYSGDWDQLTAYQKKEAYQKWAACLPKKERDVADQQSTVLRALGFVKVSLYRVAVGEIEDEIV